MKKIRLSRRVLMLVLTAALLFTSLMACNQPNEDEASATTTASSSENTTTQQPVIEPGEPVRTEGEPMVLTSEFVIVCSENQSDAMLVLANNMKAKIKAKTGISLSMGYKSSPKEKEIILGYLEDRPACAPAYAVIGGDDYHIYTAENTLVLGAWTNDTLSQAVDLFIEQALVKEGDQWLIYPYRVNFGDSAAVGIDLSQYRIVYAADAGNYLQNTVVPYLQENLKAGFGVDVPAVSDAEAPIAYEIVVGDTNRSTDTIRGYLNDGTTLTSYGHAIITEGTRIYLLSHSDFALYYAATTLCEQATPEIGPANFCPGSEPWFSPSPKTDDKIELAEGADIRIMSYNILNPNWGGNAIELGRDKNVANILLYYMPDVVGVQETFAGWHRALQKYLVDTGMYAFACQRTNAKGYNMTTLMYNTQTVKLIDEYVVDLDKYSDIRVFSVAVFEKLSDGKRFIVTNTHPAPTGQAENYQRNFADLMRIAADELAKYKDLPGIMTGDFNTKEQSAMYTNFMNAAGVKDAKYEADVLVRDYCTFSGWQKAPIKGNGNCIDHIFVNSNTDVKLFNVVIDHDVANTSDHIPIYADIALK